MKLPLLRSPHPLTGEGHCRSLAHSLSPAVRVACESWRNGRGATVRELLEPLGNRAAALGAALLALPLLWPLSLGPITTIVAVVLFFLGIQLVRRRRELMLPDRILAWRVPARGLRAIRRGVALLARWRHIARFLEQTTPRPVTDLDVSRTTGFGILAGAVLLAVPIPFLPLTNTFPALGILCFALYYVRHNRLYAVLGMVCHVVGLVLLVGLVVGIMMLGEEALDSFKTTMVAHLTPRRG